MTNADVIMMFSIFTTVMIAGFGGIGGILIKMNGTLGEIKGTLDNHDKRITKLEKKRR